VHPESETCGERSRIIRNPELIFSYNANRDGEIKFNDGSDKTTPEKPFRFWCNEDIDKGHVVDETDWEEDDLETGDPDYKDKKILYRRDLEDFQRIWIKSSLALTDQDTIELSWEDVTEGSPSINVYPAAESDGGRAYLTDESIQQIYPAENNGNNTSTYFGQALDFDDNPDSPSVSQGHTFTFPVTMKWDANQTRYFLFEGVNPGKGALKVAIKRGTQEIASAKVYLDLKNIKEFYENWTVGDGNVEPSQTAGRIGNNYPPPSKDEEKDYVLYVHGWNMLNWEKERWAETAFKRLWWQGYKGRFGVFRWPCLTGTVRGGADWTSPGGPATFDPSEFKAWKSGTGLLNCLTQLNGSGYAGRVRVLAHSQGNVVMMEALRQANHQQVVHAYVATQAAVPAHCYDASLPSLAPSAVPPFPTTPNIYARFWQEGQDNQLPVRWTGNLTSYAHPNYISGTAGQFVNFFNPVDYALKTFLGWENDQRTKPNNYYNYSDALGFHYDPWDPFQARGLTFPADRFEVFAYCAEGQSAALGARADVGGVFNVTKHSVINSYACC